MNQKLLKNIFGSWMGFGCSTLLAVFLTPFILHRLGATGFGLWILATTVTGYYGILDFGLRSAIIRYVSRDAANQDWDGISRTASTTFFLYSIVGSAIILLSLLIAWKFDTVFHIAPEWRKTGIVLVLVLGCGSGFSVPLTVFGGILEGMQKFYISGRVQAVAALVRGALIVWALKSGFGLIALGIISASTNFVSGLLYWRMIYGFCPAFQLHWNNVRRGLFRSLVSYGGVTFAISIALQLRVQADSIVIGSFLGVQLITMFAIGAKLVSYSTDAVQFMAQVFTPLSSHFEARGEWKQLQSVLIVGNRYASFMILPLASVWLILGKVLIRLWVGSAYLDSYRILVILIVPTTLYLAQAASNKIMFGMSRHSALAAVLLAEGIANLGLSILLLRWFGVEGVALGTAIPLVCTSLLFLPHYVCKLVRLRLRDYVREAFSYPLLLTIPFALVLWTAQRWIQPHDFKGLFVVLMLGGVVYGIGLLAYFYWEHDVISFEPTSTTERENPAALLPSDLAP